jgi:RNA polymerase sigma-70 factor (ECF subfamily)
MGIADGKRLHRRIMTRSQKSTKQVEFEREALPHLDLLYNYSRRMINSSADAEDLVQETFLKAFRFWDGYERGTNVKAWLFKILKNSYINQYPKESREPEQVDYDSTERKNDHVGGSSEAFMEQMLEDDVTKAMASLPEEFRTVVILCDIEGLVYEEIAEFVEVPVGTVRSRIHRGRKLLRAKLFEYAKKKGYVA